MRGRRIRCVVLTTLFLGGMAWACQVPVFRYALERWVADPYRVQILHKGGMSEALKQAIDQLPEVPVNVEVRAYELDGLSEAEEWQIDGVAGDATLPLMRVLPPRGDGQDEVVWEVPATTNTLAQLVDSPFRQQMLAEVMRGVSAVWVVVPGSDPAAADAFETVLRRDLVVLQKTLALPEGVIHAGALEHADARPDQPIDLDDVLRSHIPLKLDFAVLRLDPSDPREAAS